MRCRRSSTRPTTRSYGSSPSRTMSPPTAMLTGPCSAARDARSAGDRSWVTAGKLPGHLLEDLGGHVEVRVDLLDVVVVVERVDQLEQLRRAVLVELDRGLGDRKSTRLNSSHANISYAVFCLKKKKKTNETIILLTGRTV